MSKLKSLGVAIGRFQTPELHEGHIGYLNAVHERHEKMLILVGYDLVRFNTENPYPFPMRKQILQSVFPDAVILPVRDSAISHVHWSETVDELVAKVAQGRGAVLYGGRQSFIPLYTGQYSTEELPELPHVSATTVREDIGGQIIDDPMFRRGWLAAIRQQYVVTDPTVDVVVHTSNWRHILMGRRGAGSPLRFFGGFVDPEDQSYEEAANRERAEEALGIKVGEPQYVGSCRIKDPRYGRSKYGIMTTFFAMEYQGGEAEAGDDMGVAEWVELTPALRDQVTTTHHGLLDLLHKYREQQIGQAEAA